MAGFWHLSHHQMRDPNGVVFDGARALFYEAATLNVIEVYQDYGLGTPHPSPVVANAYGIFPPVFFDEADNFYRQRITDKNGVTIPGSDVGTLPIIGPSGGGGGSEVPVDPNALLKTGDVIWLDQSGARAGFVRDNGRTIGSSTSGGSERANADCESLYLFLWATYSDTISPVTGGRGLTSAADWAANKPIGLPDKRGYIPGGLSDMGSADSLRFANVPIVTGSAITAGSVLGESVHTLTVPETPSHNHAITDPGHAHGPLNPGYQYAMRGAGGEIALGTSGSVANSTASAVTGISLAATGGSGAHNNTPLLVLGTFYRKL